MRIKIRFKKKRLYLNLLFGLFWMVVSVIDLFNDEGSLRYFSLMIGILYVGQYAYEANQQYLIIEHGTIRKNALHGFRKKINLNKIQQIKTFAGDYTLKTETQQLKINTTLIEKESLNELNNRLEKLNIPFREIPIANTTQK